MFSKSIGFFTFSAKERDVETGLSYFSSRYYSSDLSIWLSVDPQASKYPGLSPYVYCANNPVKLVDPNGEEIGNYYDVCGNYIGKDGIDDNEVYIVTDGSDLNTIESRTNAGKTIQLSEVNSAMRLPLFETRKEIYSQLDNGEIHPQRIFGKKSALAKVLIHNALILTLQR